MAKKIYISAPINGYDLNERKRFFEQKEEEIKALGYIPVNPMENAVFSKLKYGDKLVSIDSQGEVKYYTYLCRDPNNKDKWAFLACQDDSTIRPYYTFIEKMFLHECYEKTKAYAEQIRTEYYRKWLKEHIDTNSYW